MPTSFQQQMDYFSHRPTCHEEEFLVRNMRLDLVEVRRSRLYRPLMEMARMLIQTERALRSEVDNGRDLELELKRIKNEAVTKFVGLRDGNTGKDIK